MQSNNEGGEEAANIRSRYLEHLGLKWDPFIIPVAEQEFSVSKPVIKKESIDTKSDIFSLAFFVTPNNPINPDVPLINALREPTTSFVLGSPGLGKTSLRFALEATCRRLSNRTLVVSYVLGQDINTPPTIEEHWQQLSRQFAIDLFIQIVERFKPGIDTPTANQIKSLAGILQIGGQSLQRIAKYIITPLSNDNSSLGIANYWAVAGRRSIYYVDRSHELTELIQKAIDINQNKKQIIQRDWAALQACLEGAMKWNFQNIMVLVDGVDNWSGNPGKMASLILPLLQETANLREKAVFLKYFLPETLEPTIEKFVNEHPNLFPEAPSVFQLKWSESALRRLLFARFKAAGSRRVSLNDLVAADCEFDLDQWLYDQAQGSPRRLLQLVSNLIDAHLQQTYRQQKPLNSALDRCLVDEILVA